MKEIVPKKVSVTQSEKVVIEAKKMPEKVTDLKEDISE